MSTRHIHVFISHSWTYSGHYDKLASWISNKNWSIGQASLRFSDYSVPKDDPIHNAPSDAALQKAIYNQISRSHIVVVPTGMYTNYSKWIKKEIVGAQSYNKPILGVNPWGQQRTAEVVSSASDEVVGWTSESVVKGIWRLYKSRWG